MVKMSTNYFLKNSIIICYSFLDIVDPPALKLKKNLDF